MTTTDLTRPPRETVGEALDGALPLVGVVPVAGPPIVLLAGPWLLFGLMLAGPFAVLLTLVLLFVAAWAVVGLAGALLATPYLLVRRHRRHGRRRAGTRAPARPLVAVRSRGAVT